MDSLRSGAADKAGTKNNKQKKNTPTSISTVRCFFMLNYPRQLTSQPVNQITLIRPTCRASYQAPPTSNPRWPFSFIPGVPPSIPTKKETAGRSAWDEKKANRRSSWLSLNSSCIIRHKPGGDRPLLGGIGNPRFPVPTRALDFFRMNFCKRLIFRCLDNKNRSGLSASSGLRTILLFYVVPSIAKFHRSSGAWFVAVSRHGLLKFSPCVPSSRTGLHPVLYCNHCSRLSGGNL